MPAALAPVTSLAPKMTDYGTPEVGQDVWWFPARGMEPHAAKITQVNSGSVNLAIFEPDMRQLLPRDGVRHVDDPRVRPIEIEESGLWDFTPLTKRLLTMAAELEG